MEIKVADEFRSAMQKLSAEAEKTLPENSYEEDSASTGQYTQILEEFRSLNGRLQRLEEMVTSQLEKLSSTQPTNLAAQFRQMDEHMVALCNTESVNQRLFDSLHEELIKYRSRKKARQNNEHHVNRRQSPRRPAPLTLRPRS